MPAIPPLSVVRVWHGRPNEGGTYLGSAFFVTPSHLLTAAHVVSGCQNWSNIRLNDGPWPGGLRGLHIEPILHGTRDIALLTLSRAIEGLVPVSFGDCDPKEGDDIQVAGYASMTGQLETPSVTIAGYDGERHTYIAHTFIGTGMSGGAALRDGRIVGVTQARDTDRNRTYIIPLSAFQAFLSESAGVSFEQPNQRRLDNGRAETRSSSSDPRSAHVERFMPYAESDPASNAGQECGKTMVQTTLPPGTDAHGRRFRIALSFSGAQREFVESVADALAAHLEKDRVFFYPWHEHETNGPGNLALQVPDFYLRQADLAVAFLSKEYAQSKPCAAEWRSLLELIYAWQSRRLMLFRFDDAPLEGLRAYDAYSEIAQRTAAEIAELIRRRWELDHGTNDGVGEQDADRAYAALREVVGERIRGRLQRSPLRRLRTDGGLFQGQAEPAGADDLLGLLDALHQATRRCIPLWRKDLEQHPDRREELRRDCRLLLGDLLKLGVGNELDPGQFESLAQANADRIEFPCRRIGSATVLYCALRDLPLDLSQSREDEDVLADSVIDLDGLAMGVGRDLRDDTKDAIWLRVRNKTPPQKAWDQDRMKTLKAYIDRHWRVDGRWYLLTTADPQNAGAFQEVAKETAVGLVVRDRDAPRALFKIGEADLIAALVEYLELLETL